MLHRSEEILRAIEGGISTEVVPAEAQLFMQDKAKSEEAWAKNREIDWWRPGRWWHIPLSFYHSFRLVFLFFGLAGFVIGISALFLPGQQPTQNPPVPQQNFYIGNQPIPNPATKAGG